MSAIDRPAPAGTCCGEVAEWLKAHAWNACIRETVSRVRIPLSPPDSLYKQLYSLRIKDDWDFEPYL